MKRILLVAMLLVPVLAHGADGVRLAPDASAILVNKDVGTARWAIALNTDVTSHARGDLTGSIFRPDQEPIFFWCNATDIVGEGNLADVTFEWDCYMQEKCAPGHCTTGLSAWQSIGRVTLSGRFFLP